MTNSHTTFRTCNLCEAMCGLKIQWQGSQINKIQGDPDDVFSQGYICPKALALQDIYNDPDRLDRPLAKDAKGEWQPIEWNEAFDRVAEKINTIQAKHGRNALGVYLGNPNVHNLGFMVFGPLFLRALKTRNKFSATSVDQLPHQILASQLFGHQLQIPVPDLDRCDHFVMLGANPMASNGSMMSVPNIKARLKALGQRGKLVVIDPRRTETAKVATEHHFIRPGTDAMLLLAMINHLFTINGTRLGHLADAIDGLEGLDQHVAPYTPERLAPVIGISAAEIERLTAEFLAAEAPVMYGRMGCSVQEFGLLTQYLIMVFNLLTGRLDTPGGMMFPKPAVNVLAQSGPGQFNKTQSRVRQLPSFGSEYPVATLADEILTPGKDQIKGMVICAGNPVLSTPNGKRLDSAFEQLDFMVAIDFYLTETTRHADIILPPVSPVERDHYDIVFNNLAIRNTAKFSPALFRANSALEETQRVQEWEIYAELASRIDENAASQAQAMAQIGLRGLLDNLLKAGPYDLSLRDLKEHPHGIDLGPLLTCLPEKLTHSDKKIHLEPDFFLGDLTRLEAALARQETRLTTSSDDTHSFLLIGKRHLRDNNSWLHNSERLSKGKSRFAATISPTDAKALTLREGAKIKVTSKVGSIELPVAISDDMMPKVISIPHGWGHDRTNSRWRVAEKNPGVSVNDITDHEFIDALSGNAALNGLSVQVEKIADAPESTKPRTKRAVASES